MLFLHLSDHRFSLSPCEGSQTLSLSLTQYVDTPSHSPTWTTALLSITVFANNLLLTLSIIPTANHSTTPLHSPVPVLSVTPTTTIHLKPPHI